MGSTWTPAEKDEMVRQSFPLNVSAAKRLMMDSSRPSSSYSQQLQPYNEFNSSLPSMGLAGNVEAEYYRIEEVAGKLHPELDAAITSMHDNLIQYSPKLLPLFRRLQHEIHVDRTRSLMEKSSLLGKLSSKKSFSDQTTAQTPLSKMAITPQKSRLDKNRFQRISDKDKETSKDFEGKIDFDSIKKRAKL